MSPSGLLEYGELIAGIREGNSSAVTKFRNTFTSGIQLFIARESHEADVLGRVEEVIASVIEEIKEGHVTGPDLPSQILKSVRRNIGLSKLSRKSTKPETRNHGATITTQLATGLLKAIPEREREALKRYYVDPKAENRICAELDLPIDQFRNSKRRLRAQFIDARHRAGL